MPNSHKTIKKPTDRSDLLTTCLSDQVTYHSVTTRRTLLRRTVVALAASAAAIPALALAASQPDQGGEEDRPNIIQPQTTDTPPPAMRSPRNVSIQAAEVAVQTPPLAVIALNRMSFGPRPGDLEALLALAATPQAAFEAYVEQQLNPSAIDDSAFETLLAQQGFTTLNKSRTQLWLDHFKPPALPWEDRQRPAKEVERTAFLRAVYSKRQLVEVLADFWHNHFNVYAYDYWIMAQFVAYDRDVIRANLLGNFRQMLGAVARSTAMLYYLDNTSNTSAGPNENYARELFELHTMGAENYGGVIDRSKVPVDSEGRPTLYIDKDVYQATQCFTGWRIDGETGEFKFDEAIHAKYEKTVLGTLITDFQGIQDGETVLDLLANHPGTARYIARKLCRRLISDTPPESIVQAAADVFYAQRNAPDQLKQVVRTILLSSEFRTTWGQKVKRPFEYVVNLLRATEANFSPNNDFLWQYGQSGQPLYQWQPPNGYPDNKETWSSTMPMLQRWRRCNWIVHFWTIGGTGTDKDVKRVDLVSKTPATVTTPVQIVDFWCNRMLGYTLPDVERQPIIEFLAAGRNVEYDLPADLFKERLPGAVELILMSPSFLWK